MAVGDKYFYISDRMVVVKSETIAVGDKVICMKTGGLIKPGTPIVGSHVIIVSVQSGKVVVGIAYDNYVFVIGEWSRSVAARYEEVYLGSFDFNWLGVGQVYLSSVPGAPTDIGVDDYVRVETAVGTLSFGPITPQDIYRGIPNITSICQYGLNSINIYIIDYWDGYIGSSDIYIMTV